MAGKVSVGAVWNSTTDVLGGRAGMMVPVALVALALPAAAQAALRAAMIPGPTTSLVVTLAWVAALVPSLWGSLVLLDLASAPSVGAADARRAATARLPASLGITLAFMAGLVLLLIPLSAMLVAAGVDVAAMSRGSSVAAGMTPGLALLLFGYLIVVTLLVLWLVARLLPLQAVILHERRGLGAFSRSFALTRGVALKLVAVLLLFGVVLIVVGTAVEAVATVVLTLVLGGGGVAVPLVVGFLSALVSTALTVPAYVFVARLYAALIHREGAPLS